MLKSIKEVIKKIKGFTAKKNDYREELQGIFFTEDNKAVAIDGYRAVYVECEGIEKVGLLNAQQIKDAKNINEEDFTLQDHSTHDLIKNVENGFDEVAKAEVTVDATKLLNAVKEGYKASGLSKLTLKSGLVHLNYNAKTKKAMMQFAVKEGTKATIDGIKTELNHKVWYSVDITELLVFEGKKKEFKVTLNAKYLTDALNSYKKNEVITMKFMGQLKSVFFIGQGIKHLVLPFRFSDELIASYEVVDAVQINNNIAEIKESMEKRYEESKQAKEVPPTVEEVEPKEVVEVEENETKEISPKEEEVAVVSGESVEEDHEPIYTYSDAEIEEYASVEEEKVEVHNAINEIQKFEGIKKELGNDPYYKYKNEHLEMVQDESKKLELYHRLLILGENLFARVRGCFENPIYEDAYISIAQGSYFGEDDCITLEHIHPLARDMYGKEFYFWNSLVREYGEGIIGETMHLYNSSLADNPTYTKQYSLDTMLQYMVYDPLLEYKGELEKSGEIPLKDSA